MRYSFFFLLFFLSLLSCKKEVEKQISHSGNVSEYLVSIPPTHISVKDAVRFRFKSEYSAKDMDPAVKGIKVKPKVSGSFKWIDNHELAFVPDVRFDYDEQYVFILDLKELITSAEIVNDRLRLSTSTRRFGYDISIEGPRIKVEGGKQVAAIQGIISSSDFAGKEEVEKILSAFQKGNREIYVVWAHSGNAREHSFTIKNIQIENNSAPVLISWNGGREDPKFKGKEKIIIPGSGNFNVDHARISTRNGKHISVLFTNPLKVDQNLDGLIKIDNRTSNQKYLIDGNELKIYLAGIQKEKIDLEISEHVRNFSNKSLDASYQKKLLFVPEKPAIRLLGQGVIVPLGRDMNFPFEAINVKAVDLEVFKIFEDNILQFLQNNDLAGGYDLGLVGRIVHQEKIDLSALSSERTKNEWTRYGIDLSRYMADDPNTLYKIRLGFKRDYSDYPCENEVMAEVKSTDRGFTTIMIYPSDYQGYRWEHSKDPCYPAYYNYERFVERNLLISNVGVVAKKAFDGNYTFSISALDDLDPLSNANIKLYDYQKQFVGEARSNSDGFVKINPSREASFAVVNHSEGFAYVRLRDENANSLSSFDVGGKQPSKLDAFIYTDRGVYRPGDTIFLHMMLDDTPNPLPDNHPVSLQLLDVNGDSRFEQTTSEHMDKIYSFTLPTHANDKTGKWQARIKIGSKEFVHSIRVETVKPNRLKVELSAPELITAHRAGNNTIELVSRWLHGASASGLLAQVDASYRAMRPPFRGFDGYSFSDPGRQTPGDQVVLFKKNLDEEGETSFDIEYEDPSIFPSMVNAQIRTRVFEKGGDFSENYASLKISPFRAYVGLKIPENRWGYKSVKVGEAADIDVVSLDEEGNVVPNRRLTVGLYDVHWRWWYYSNERYNVYRFNSVKHEQAVWKDNIRTDRNGKAVVNFNFQDEHYGRKLLRICDEESGHCAGEFFYLSLWGAPMDEERKSLSKLNFTANKKTYDTGENVELSIPSEAGSKILISIENNMKVIFQEWIEGEKDQTAYRFSLAPEMAPNVYVHATYIQPFGNNENDLPLRMYGVLPIKVTNVKTMLKPEIKTTPKYEPNESFEVIISEADQKAMTYTVAIVDEGFLDLTNFKTPSPHSHFYAKQSLGVRTWDMYDHVLNGFGEIDKIISVGGDSDTEKAVGAKKAIRFKPVVISDGPYRLASGTSQKLRYTMPNYVGSVRIMIVARDDNAYGKAEEAVPVKEPLMVQATLPRVVSPGEEVEIPVNIFAMEDDIRNVNVQLTTSENVNSAFAEDQKLRFTRQGEKMAYFDVDIGEDLGIAKFEVTASSSKYKMDQQYELQIRNPNAFESTVNEHFIEENDQWTTIIKPVGMKGSNEGILEFSTMPPIRLEDRLNYLVRYPHGCLEQTTSALFPQLYLGHLKDLSKEYSDLIKTNLREGIAKLQRMQMGNGAFKYWPSGGSQVNEWCTSYAGHFLIEAKNDGYYVQGGKFEKFIKYQKNKARSFSITGLSKKYRIRSAYHNQAYRLYTLALAGEADLPSMNVLRLDPNLPAMSKFLLAAAYAYTGNEAIALELINNVSLGVSNYDMPGDTYGSNIRDDALIAQCMIALNKDAAGAALIKEISEKLNSGRWYSTQSLAHALLAISKFNKDMDHGPIDVEFTIGDNAVQQMQSEKSIALFSFDPDHYAGQNVRIVNNSTGPLYTKINLRGQPSPTETLERPARNEHIKILVEYKDMERKPLDVQNLNRGTDFLAEVTITNLNTKGTDLQEMALTQIFPSGWEILSGRLDNLANTFKEDSYDYRDVRDDRVFTYFDLKKTKKYIIKLNAAYGGSYFLPSVICEAMYDNEIAAKTEAMKVEIRPTANGRRQTVNTSSPLRTSDRRRSGGER